MLVPSKVVSCISNPNYQRNSFWNMDDATDSTPIDTVPTWDSDAPPEVIHLYQVCDTNTWWVHNESIWIQNESIMNPRSMPFTTLLWCRPLRSSANAMPVDVGLCSRMRRLRSTEETDSLAKTFEHRRLDEAETGGWVERVSNQTELNWTDEWIDGLMLTLMDVFFFTPNEKFTTPLDATSIKMTPKKSMVPKKAISSKISGTHDMMISMKRTSGRSWWCFPSFSVRSFRWGVGVLGCSFSQRGTCSMCCWSTMGLGAEVLGSSSCNAARCLWKIDVFGVLICYVEKWIRVDGHVNSCKHSLQIFAWTLNSFTGHV